MLKKLTTILAAVTLIMTLTGNALASFADLELIRIVYERTTGTTEIATDMGNVNTLIASGGTIAGPALSANNPSNLFVAYFAIDKTAGAINNFWVSGSTNIAPVAVGSPGFITTKSATTNVFSFYNLLIVTNGTVTGSQAAANSYRNKMTASQGAMNNAINIATRVNTEGSLAALVNGTATSLTQNLYVLNANSANSQGTAVATITTNADGSTTISKAPPNVIIDTPPPATSGSATVSIGFTVTDAVGVSAYLLSETSTPPLASDTGWVAITPATSFSLTTDYSFNGIVPGVPTNKTLYVWAKDSAGNVSVQKSSATVITIPAGDTTPPVVTITAPSPFTSATVDITFTATDSVGVTAYLLTETAQKPLATDLNWVSVSPASTSFSSNVSHTFSALDPGASSTKMLYVWAKDAADNVSNADSTANVQITIVKPAKITGIAPTPDPYFLLLQDAVNSAADGDTIQAMINTFTETVMDVNRPNVTITLKGGFDSGYLSNSAGVSTLHGQMLISRGTLVAEKLEIN